MKDLHGSFVFAVCLLAFTALVFFFKYGSERAHSSVLEAQKQASENVAMNLEKEVTRRAEIGAKAEKAARKNIERANQARKMLEKARAESEMTQKELLDNLNAQLEREAEARMSAQKASEELTAQRDALILTVEKTRKTLTELRDKKQASNEAEIARMKKLLAAKEAEIERLKARQIELERLQAEATEAQRKTESEILERGGQIFLPKYRRILSPNIRSR